MAGPAPKHGVLEPIIAVPSSDGIRVRYGHRRTLAAIEAGQPTVPVIVMGEDDQDELARLTTQCTRTVSAPI